MWSRTLVALVGLLTTAIDDAYAAELKLVSVQSIFRHGDRAPSKPYPKDPIGIDRWPNGWSQLTDLGAAQSRELGAYYRRRYGSKLRLNQRNVYVKSTSKERAIETAQNVLIGLYDRHNNLPEVHINGDYRHDLLLKPNSVPCAAYDRELAADNERLFSKYDRLYADFFLRLSQLTGYNVSMENVDQVFDPIYRERIHGVSEAKWLDELVLNRETGALTTAFGMIVELKRIQRLAEFNSPAKARLRTGYLLGQIVEGMERVRDGGDAAVPKLALYSSHDATLTSLLYSMNVSNELLVPYAAAISFELYADATLGPQHMPTFYVKTLYRNETGNDEAYELHINGCDEQRPACKLDHFVQLLKSAIYRTEEEHERACSSWDGR